MFCGQHVQYGVYAFSCIDLGNGAVALYNKLYHDSLRLVRFGSSRRRIVFYKEYLVEVLQQSLGTAFCSS